MPWPLALIVVGCVPAEPEPPPIPSVLLVTLGDVGVDRLVTHPLQSLDDLRRRGTDFDRAYTSSPDREVALATLLLGASPPAHGVRGPSLEWPASLPTLPETFVAAERETAAWGSPATLSALPRWMSHAAGSDAERVSGAIRERADFTWIHLEDAAWPCEGGSGPVLERCDRALDAVDASLQALLEALPPGPDRWVVVAGDRGLPQSDAGVPTVGAMLDDATLRVPLVMAGGPWSAEVSHDPVGLADVGATLHALGRGVPLAADLRVMRPEGVWHEASAGARWLGLVPLTGWTFTDGRYVQGAWAATYPRIGDGSSIADQPTHRTPRGPSARPEASALAAAAGSNRVNPVVWSAEAGAFGDPAPGPGIGDARDAAPALGHLGRTLERLRLDLTMPAERELNRLAALRRGAWAVHWLAADVALATGELPSALRQLDRLHSETDSPAVALRAAEIALRLGQPALAMDAAAEALRVEPSADGALRLMAIAAARAGERPAAEEACAALIRSGARAEVALGELALLDGDPKSAIAQAQSALARDGSDLDARLVLGRALARSGEGDAAVAELWAVLEVHTLDVPARRALASIALEDGAPGEAVRLLAPVLVAGEDPVTADLLRQAQGALEQERGAQIPKRPWR